jgi:hypothetical protein
VQAHLHICLCGPSFMYADKSKAAKAAKAVKKSQFKKTRKPRYSVVFHRPKTLVRSRDPKFPRVRCVCNAHA